jgi:hypothetical protein
MLIGRTLASPRTLGYPSKNYTLPGHWLTAACAGFWRTEYRMSAVRMAARGIEV